LKLRRKSTSKAKERLKNKKASRLWVRTKSDWRRDLEKAKKKHKLLWSHQQRKKGMKLQGKRDRDWPFMESENEMIH
jgi:hypothetical protein